MNILKRRFLCILIFTLFFNLTSYGYCTVYYVKNAGDDYASGLSDQEAWRTLSRVNTFNFSDGDIVCLKRESRFDDATLLSPNVNNFTFRDYGEGKKPHIDGDRIKPINIIPDKTIKNLTIKNIDISGQDWYIRKDSNIIVKNVSTLTIDGIIGNGHYNGNVSNGKTAISIIKCAGHIVVKNCLLYNWGPTDLPKQGQDFMGIVLSNITKGYYEIHNNTVHNVNADCIHLYENSAKGLIHDNTIFNAGEDGIDVKGTQNCEIYNNEFYCTADFIGGGGSGGYKTLIIVHEGKSPLSKNVIIRNNRFHNGDAIAVVVGQTEDVSIYYNYFNNTSGTVLIGNHSRNTEIHHNIIINPQSRNGWEDMDAGCIYENNSYTGTRIFNNTIYNNTGNAKHLISLACSQGTEVFRNIIFQGNTANDSFCFYKNPCGKPPVVHDNCWYNQINSNIIKFDSRSYDVSSIRKWNKIAKGDLFIDPLFTNPTGGDYSLLNGSPCMSGVKHWGAGDLSKEIGIPSK